MEGNKEKIIMQICCVGCGVFIAKELSEEFEVLLYYYNPNIFPLAEFDLRLEEARRIAARFGLALAVSDYDHQGWLKMVRGLEDEPERGKRCSLCYRDRMAAAAKLAKEQGAAYFGTTLTTSPHKDAVEISRIGNELALQYGVSYLDRDFKKNDGFKKSCILTKDLQLYRQDYCGCEFSMRKNIIKTE